MTGGIVADARAIRQGETDPVALTRRALADLEQWEPRIRCSISVLADRALEAAERARDELRRGEDRGPIHGIPIGIKDLIDVAGVPTTAGSKILHDNVPAANAPVVDALEQAGAVVIAKTNTHEFAFGALTPPTRNPHDTSRMPGGSSGGSGAMVGAGIVHAALGSDTGGSIREPAAMCGVVGLKPTAGRTDNAGVVPLAWSLDTVGPLAATPEDCALAFAAMGPSHARRSRGRVARTTLPGTRLGVWRELEARMQAPVRRGYRRALDALADDGARLEERELGEPDEYVAATLVVLCAEALSYHRRWLEDRRQDYQPDVREFLDLAATFGAADLVDAERVRRAFTRQVDAILSDADAVVTPAQVVLPPRVDDREVAFDDGRRGPYSLAMIRPLAPFNLTGHPAVSVPVDHDDTDGLPISIQLVGPYGDDESLLRLAARCQRACAYRRRLPRP